MENQPFLDQLRRVLFRWHLRPKRINADTTYTTVDNVEALEEEGIVAFMPLPDPAAPLFQQAGRQYSDT